MLRSRTTCAQLYGGSPMLRNDDLRAIKSMRSLEEHSPDTFSASCSRTMPKHMLAISSARTASMIKPACAKHVRTCAHTCHVYKHATNIADGQVPAGCLHIRTAPAAYIG